MLELLVTLCQDIEDKDNYHQSKLMKESANCTEVAL